MGRIAVTGIGPVTPFGIGKAAFMEALSKGFSTVGEAEGMAARVDAARLEEVFSDRRFRRAADITKYALASISLALDDSGAGKGGARGETGLVASITTGALNYTQSFHRAVLEEGGGAASPALFSDSVLNAPAGNAAICFGIKGPVHTLVGGETAGLKAAITASHVLRMGKVKRCIVMAAQEINELAVHCYSVRGVTGHAEGAGALVLMDEDDLEGASPYCYITGMSSCYYPSGQRASLEAAVGKCLGMGGAGVEDVALLLINPYAGRTAGLLEGTGLKDVPLGCFIPVTGDGLSTTAIWHLIAAAASLGEGVVPRNAMLGGTAALQGVINNVLVCSYEKEGPSAAVLLSRR